MGKVTHVERTEKQRLDEQKRKKKELVINVLALSFFGMALVFSLLIGLQGSGGEQDVSASQSQSTQERPESSEGRPELTEGVHYRVLNDPIETQSDIIEIVWFGCPFCQQVKPFMDQMKLQNPELSVKTVHGTLSDSWMEDFTAYTAAHAFEGDPEEVIDELFQSRIKKAAPLSPDEIAKLISDTRYAVSQEEVHQALSDTQAIDRKADWVRDMEIKAQAPGVPFFIVSSGEKALNTQAFSSYDEIVAAAKVLSKSAEVQSKE